MADDEQLNDAMAGMDMRDTVKDAEKMAMDLESIASSAAAMALEEARAKVKQLETEKYLLILAQQETQQQLAQANAAISPEQMKHNMIIANPVFMGAIAAMPTLDANTLWWMVQWGNEYLARFKRDATQAEQKAHDNYKKWTQMTKQKQLSNFTASLRSAAGDDSVPQTPQ